MQQREIAGSDRRAWTMFIKAVLFCYQKPEIAIHRMARYNSAKGQDALLMKLALEPAFFGTQKGQSRRQSLDISLRREIRQARELLPVLAKVAFDVDDDGAPLRFSGDQTSAI